MSAATFSAAQRALNRLREENVKSYFYKENVRPVVELRWGCGYPIRKHDDSSRFGFSPTESVSAGLLISGLGRAVRGSGVAQKVKNFVQSVFVCLLARKGTIFCRTILPAGGKYCCCCRGCNVF